MRTIIDKNTGQEFYATDLEVELKENEIAIPEIRKEAFENSYFDFENRIFYDKVE